MITTPTIAISTTETTLIDQARQLAAQLRLDFVDNPHTHSYSYLLILTPTHLALQKTDDKKLKPFYIDFLSGKIRYRYQQASRRNELLAKALGVSPKEQPMIVDATAGMGRDSFILASLGYNVTMLERSPIVHALLSDALARAQQAPEVASIANRLSIIHIDAIHWLQHPPKTPDVVYLDPMFPEKQKSASSKKEMVILQDLLGGDPDASQLFIAAQTCGAKRIVVKRPRLAEKIVDQEPNFTLSGNSSRFDIYLTK